MKAFHETKRHCEGCGKPLPYKRKRKLELCQKCNGRRQGQKGKGASANLACLKWMYRAAKHTDDPKLAVDLVYQISRQR
jgi:hypothetical protein